MPATALRPLAFFVAAVMPLATHATCPGDEAIAAWVSSVAAAQTHAGFGSDLSDEGAACARRKLVRALPSALGERVGYKAAFTSEGAQKRFGVPGPVWGAMFGKHLLHGGGIVPASLGARLMYEGDLIAVAGGPGLADAKTPLEALQHISAFAPFIELPDLMLEGKPTGKAMIAANVGFRGGVIGPRIPASATQAQLDALARMTVVLEENGKARTHVPGNALMGHPVNAAMWLARELKREGIELKAGDLLSLGGYTTPAPAKPGTTITVRYRGLAGDPAVSVRFE